LNSAYDFALLLLAVALVWEDARLTWRGLARGHSERNPILRPLIMRFGSTGLIAARILATALLLLLFALLNPSEWLLFSVPFVLVMGYVVLTNIKRTA
jgi:hypothetical protein